MITEKGGRLGYGEEFDLKKRYSALSEEYFKFISGMFENGDKADKKWASEQLSRAFVKMLPTVVEGGNPDKPIPIMYVSRNKSDSEDKKDNEED